MMDIKDKAVHFEYFWTIIHSMIKCSVVTEKIEYFGIKPCKLSKQWEMNSQVIVCKEINNYSINVFMGLFYILKVLKLLFL